MSNFTNNSSRRAGMMSGNWRGGANSRAGGAQSRLTSQFNPNSHAPSPIQEEPETAVPAWRAKASVTPSAMDNTTQQLANANLNNNGRGRAFPWNASNAPARQSVAQSMMTCFISRPGQANTVQSVAVNDRGRNKWRQNAVCIQSPWKRWTFKKGEVISLPYHEANMNPNSKLEDTNIRISEVGPVVSKRRMVIVLYKFQQTMFCLPLHSFSGRGIDSRPKGLIGQFVELINVKDHEEGYQHKGEHEPVVFKHVHPQGKLELETTVHVTAGRCVSWNEDIELVGRITQQSYNHLMKIFHQLSKAAEVEACTW